MGVFQVELMGRISSGQFGDVFKASYQGTDVAVKRMKCGAHSEKARIMSDFEHEVELISTVRHPNICMVMGAIGEWPRLCIITELCHRGSLYHILQAKDKIKLPWYRRIALAKDAATGVSILHNHNPCIVHLDLKSPNLLVDRHWGCKVCDFGLGQTKKSFYVSEGCGGVGTPEWTAPEVLKGEAFNEKAVSS
jgi:serine/threonine protein kinase